MLFDELNKQTIAKVEKTGLPYFHISEEQQKGATFGQRYTNAIEQVYAKGFENVITIGNDSPLLQASQILKAAKTLENKSIVLGPSRDGGYYLLGINKSQFNTVLFLKLPWQTSKLTGSISRLLCSKKIKVILLERLEDIDAIADAKRFINSFYKIPAVLLQVLRSLFSSEILLLEATAIHYNKFQQKIFFNKGSPLSSI